MEREPQLKFVIEQMSEQDVAEATVMRMRSWVDTYANEEAGVSREWLEEQVARELTPEQIARREEKLRKSKWPAWVAKDENGNIIGVSTPFVMDDGTQRVGGLYVDKAWHGAGVGSALMQKVIDWADPHTDLALGVADYNERAKAFYRKWGFAEIPDSTEMFRDKIPTVRMIKKGASDEV